MVAPHIVLREAKTGLIIGSIPEEVAQTYQKLEDTAFEALSRKSDEFALHFHLREDECKWQAIPYLWNKGKYFNGGYLQDGDLHAFAHFERKVLDNNNSQSRPIPVVDPPVTSTTITPTDIQTTDTTGENGDRTLHTMTPSERVTSSITATSAPGVGILSKGNGNDIASTGKATFGSSRLRRTTLQPKSLVLKTGTSALRSGSFALRTGKQAAPPVQNSAPIRISAITIPPLRAGLTKALRNTDRDRLKLRMPQPGEYGYKANWTNLSEQAHLRVAGAIQIIGDWGMPSPHPCNRCVRKGLDCRVYHISLDPRHELGSCGECRLVFHACGSSRIRLQDVPGLSEASTRRQQWPCPIPGCDRASAPFDRQENLQRHLSVHHPGRQSDEPVGRAKRRRPTIDSRAADDSSEADSGQETTPFTCPVQGCTSRSAVSGFSSQYNLLVHIKTQHPSTTQAENLQQSEGPREFPREAEGVVISRASLRRSASGRYICPVNGCDRTEGILGSENLRRHIVAKHPGYTLANQDAGNTAKRRNHGITGERNHGTGGESNHGTAGAICPNTAGETSPNPEAQFKADMALYQRHNAKQGEFGHRDPETWDKLASPTRKRIAKARSTQKNGEPAPKPCFNCRKRGVPCMRLPLQLRLGHSKCGGCQNTGAYCNFSDSDNEREAGRETASDTDVDSVFGSRSDDEGESSLGELQSSVTLGRKRPSTESLNGNGENVGEQSTLYGCYTAPTHLSQNGFAFRGQSYSKYPIDNGEEIAPASSPAREQHGVSSPTELLTRRRIIEGFSPAFRLELDG